jgi:uroporphyrinogen-III synthase
VTEDAVQPGPFVLVTRPRADAAALAAELQARALTPLLEPMLEIVFEDVPAPDLDGVQAVVFTSSNGVRAYTACGGSTGLPAFAVGDATARAARAAGFEKVESAGGDVEMLAALIAKTCRPADGALLHAAGSKRAGDLAAALAGYGFETRRAVLYRAEKAKALSARCIDAFKSEKIRYSLFFSPRTAASFVRLAEATGLSGLTAPVTACCLSKAVAAAAEALDWRAMLIAETPTQAALLAALDDDIGAGRMTGKPV